MTGRTHAAIGIASSLAVLQPKTVPECLCAVTGGLIGGMISDIDSPKKRESLDYRDDPYGWQIYTFVVIALVIILGLDYAAGDGAVDYIINNFEPSLVVGGIAFLGLCFYGAHTIHRSFTHSFLAAILFTLSVWCFCKPLAFPFAIGFMSHLVIDFLNRKKIQYLWPIRTKIGLNRYPSDGRLNDTLGAIGVIVSSFLLTYYFINSFAGSVLYTRALDLFSRPVIIRGITLPFIIPYLIVINIISFVVYIIDYILDINALGFYSGSDKDAEEMSSFIKTLLLFFDVAGGVIGKLLAVFILTRGKIYKTEELANYNFFVIPFCVLVSWLAFLFTFYFPEVTAWIKPLAATSIRGVPVRYIVLIYFLILNIVAMFLFPRMQRFGKVISKRERVCMILSLLGGASGGYLSMAMTGNHKNAVMLENTLPDMIRMHAIVLTCTFFAM